MNYFDILEKHGIVIGDEDKIEKFYTNIYNVIEMWRMDIPRVNAFSICQKIGVLANSLGIMPYSS